ncbi:uncharacterized protein LOC144624690 [Crassostrea virginica]
MNKIGDLPRSGGTISSEQQQQSASPRHLNKKSIIFITVTLVTFLAISLIALAVLSTLFILQKTNKNTDETENEYRETTPVESGTTAPSVLDPTYHCQVDTPEPKSCENGWMSSGKSCYWYNAEVLTWDQAEV